MVRDANLFREAVNRFHDDQTIAVLRLGKMSRSNTRHHAVAAHRVMSCAAESRRKPQA
jgi:hypothetical protein